MEEAEKDEADDEDEVAELDCSIKALIIVANVASSDAAVSERNSKV